jgi:septal ring factor EnvC (AmiA/AmiB activator)
MRVKIAYSVELEDIPETIADLLLDEQHLITKVNRNINYVTEHLKNEEPNMDLVLKKIDQARVSLVALDNTMADAFAVLDGFKNATKALEDQEDAKEQAYRERLAANQQTKATPPVVATSEEDTQEFVDQEPIESNVPRATTNERVDPETGTYNYERPYAVPEDSE